MTSSYVRMTVYLPQATFERVAKLPHTEPPVCRWAIANTRSQVGFPPRMTCESSKCQIRRHSAYLYPLWRFLRKIGWVFSSSIACPMYPTSATLV